MKIIHRTFTPDEAAQILATRNNLNIRKVRPKAVQNYARQMVSGKWRNSWDCIAFDKEGNLLNGQHRLSACVRSGIPLSVFVIFNAEDITGDTGMKRTALETLRGQGIEINDEFKSNIAMATLGDIAKIYLGIPDTTPEERAEIASYPVMGKLTDIIRILNHSPAGVRVSVVASAIFGGYLVTKDDRCIDFCNILASGVSNGKTAGTVIALRDWLMKNSGRRASNGDGGANEVRGTVQASLRSYLNGASAKRLNKRNTLIYKPGEEMFKEEW